MTFTKNNKKVTKKNYIIVCAIFIASIFLVATLAHWYKGYKQYNLDIPEIDGYINEISEKELNNYLVENTESILYLSRADDSRSREFEKDLKKFIKKYNLRDNMTYINLSKVENLSKFIKTFNKKYATDKELKGYPSIIIIKNGKILDIYTDKYLSMKQIKVLLEENEMLGD